MSRHNPTLSSFNPSVASLPQSLSTSTAKHLPRPSTATGQLRRHRLSTPNSPHPPFLARHNLPTPILVCGVMQANKRDHLSIISANVRGLQTNIGDLVHSCVIPHTPDVVATVETFLNDSIPNNFGIIQGYTRWHRRDRARGTFGGVAVCFNKNLSVQPLDVTIPAHLEMMFFRLWTKHHGCTLLCVCYRPQWQGAEPLQFLHTHLDRLLQQYSCTSTIIVGDLNQHMVARSFEELLTVYGLTNHVTFPTHILGGSLDPVISDLPEEAVTCRPLSAVGSSDHLAILSTIHVAALRDASMKRTNWLWGKADWEGFQDALRQNLWSDILKGDVDAQVNGFTSTIHHLQSIYVPSHTFTVKPLDQPWFGYECRVAADNKSKSWKRYKRHPSHANKQQHREACNTMRRVQKLAQQRWQTELKNKLCGRSVGTKSWWAALKEQQGYAPDDHIPPLIRPDGTVATQCSEKAEVLAAHFSEKMTVPDPGRPPPAVPRLTKATLDTIAITQEEVKHQLSSIDTKKALGPDGVSPHILKNCAAQLAAPITTIFQNCISTSKWPSSWKTARVAAIHKKAKKTEPRNYRPISLLSVLGKALEAIIARKVTSFLDKHRLISNRQFGFRPNMSANDILLQMSSSWHQSLDRGCDTFVIALDIAGAFDRVWHSGLLTKLEGMGVSGGLLALLQDYLRDRSLCVVVNGRSSPEYPVGAGVPQGSVLGPLLWNVFFNDLLQLIPQAHAYADDCTLTFPCGTTNHPATVTAINDTLDIIAAWGRRWQVDLAEDKTQVMLISRRRASPSITLPPVLLDGITLPLQPAVSILGVEVDNSLSFTGHVKKLASKAANRMNCVRRVAHLLDAKGVSNLYAAQVRSVMEYAPLTWSSCPPSYLGLLDKVQHRAQRLITSKCTPGHQLPPLQHLQHRRDVAGLCATYKIHKEAAPHLAPLRQPWATPHPHATRDALTKEQQLVVPFARTETFLRSFLPRYTRLWNCLVRQTNIHQSATLQTFKCAVNAWLCTI